MKNKTYRILFIISLNISGGIFGEIFAVLREDVEYVLPFD